jgi:DNA-binding NtrC family response regulator
MSRIRARIVILADDTGDMKLLAEALESGGHNVSLVTRSETVSRLLKSESLDILIADIGRHQPADAHTLNAIKTSYPALPIICISSLAESATTTAGANVLITKPYRIKHIEERINQLLQTRSVSGTAKADKAIIVVDDDEIFRKLLVRSLRLYGYNAKPARDGAEVLEIIEKEDICAVIADIHMPGIDGVTLLRKLKKRQPHLPVILITGYHVSDEWPAESAVPPDGFLMKPFKIQHIEQLLGDITKQRSGP